MSKNFYKNNHLYYFLILFFIFGLAFIRCKNHEPLTDIKSNINTIEKINHYPLVLTNKISSIQIPLIEYSKINYDQKKISVGCHFKSINTQIRIEGNSFCGSHYLSEESIYFFNNINSQQVNNYFYIKDKSNYSTIYYYKLNNPDLEYLGLWHEYKLSPESIRIWVYNNNELTLIGNLGNPSTNKSLYKKIKSGIWTSVPVMSELFIILELQSPEEGEISQNNFHFYIDTLIKMNDSKLKYLLYEGFIFGLIVMGCMYNILLYSLRKTMKSSFWLSIYCLLLGIRSLIISGIPQLLLTNLDLYNIFSKGEYLTAVTAGIAGIYYIKSIYNNQINYLLTKILTISGYLTSIFIVLFWSDNNTLPLYIHFVWVILAGSWGVFEIGRKLYSQNQGLVSISKDIIFNSIIFAFAVYFDIYTYIFNIHIIDIFGLGLVVFLYGQAYIIARINAEAWEKSEYLSEKLEVEVKDRTLELERKNKFIEELNLLTKSINENSEFEKIILQIHNHLRNKFQIEEFLIGFIEKNSNILKFKYLTYKLNDQHMNEIFSLSIPINEKEGVLSLSLFYKRAIFIKNNKKIKLTLEENKILELLEIQSMTLLPLILNGINFGFICLFNRTYNLKFSKKKLLEVSIIIDQLSGVIYSSNLYRELEDQKKEVESTLSELRSTQAQLIEAEKMASLGQLIGGVAHEINNPIGVIKSNSELIKNNLNSTLKNIPTFLESLDSTEKNLLYEIIEIALKNKEILSSKEERTKKKQIQFELGSFIPQRDLLFSITDSIITLKLTSSYDKYLRKLGGERFKEFLDNAQILVNQSNSLNNIEIAVEKASRVIFALRSYLNTEIYFNRKEIDLVQEIEKALHLYDNYIIGKINIIKNYSGEIKYTCIPENISQAWKNIIFNSIQSMYTSSEKKLQINIIIENGISDDLFNMYPSRIEKRSKDRLKLEKNIIISFIDWGIGIPQKDKDKIFTPFFTTKALGEGIGLGLYVSKKIIHEHGGSIFFDTYKENTQFTVILPLKE